MRQYNEFCKVAYKVVSGGIELEPHEYSVRDLDAPNEKLPGLNNKEKFAQGMKSVAGFAKKHPVLSATAVAAPVIGSALLLGKKRKNDSFKNQQETYQQNKEEEQVKAASEILDEMVKGSRNPF